MSMPASVCCICLDAVPEKKRLLTCCDRLDSTTRCCAACLERIRATTGRCPLCRADITDKSISTTMLGSALWRLWALGKFAFGELVVLITRPMDMALEQALESAFSRGPV